jgi:AraC-like DNA-binding protein
MSKQSDILLRKRSLASLEAIGFAVGHFPCYHSGSHSSEHGHDILEANLVVRGHAFHRINGIERNCTPGSLGIVPYTQKHSLVTDEKGVEVINLYLDPVRHPLPDLPAELSQMAETLFPTPLPGIARSSISFLQFADPAPVVELLMHCWNEQERQSPGYLSVMESALRMVLILCARQAMQEGVQTCLPNHPAQQKLEKVRLLLEQDYASDHSLASLAHTACMSSAHFCRSFKAYAGVSPIEYLVQRRLRAAMQELRNSSQKISTVAQVCGFRDLGYFNRKFLQTVGSCPSQYRKQFR